MKRWLIQFEDSITENTIDVIVDWKKKNTSRNLKRQTINFVCVECTIEDKDILINDFKQAEIKIKSLTEEISLKRQI